MKYPIKVLNFKRYCMMNILHLIALTYATVSKRVPIIGTGSLQGPFLAFWVPIGPLFIFQGPYFQCFGFIYAKNVNSVCMYTTMSYLDLSVMSNDLHCYYTYMFRHVILQVIMLFMLTSRKWRLFILFCFRGHCHISPERIEGELFLHR